MNIRQTKEERDAERVARLLVKALLAIEVFPHDPEMIFEVPVTLVSRALLKLGCC